jgi:hypothetical protein
VSDEKSIVLDRERDARRHFVVFTVVVRPPAKFGFSFSKKTAGAELVAAPEWGWSGADELGAPRI